MKKMPCFSAALLLSIILRGCTRAPNFLRSAHFSANRPSAAPVEPCSTPAERSECLHTQSGNFVPGERRHTHTKKKPRCSGHFYATTYTYNSRCNVACWHAATRGAGTLDLKPHDGWVIRLMCCGPAKSLPTPREDAKPFLYTTFCSRASQTRSVGIEFAMTMTMELEQIYSRIRVL